MDSSKHWCALHFKFDDQVILKDFIRIQKRRVRYLNSNSLGKNYAISLISSSGFSNEILPFSIGSPFKVTSVGRRAKNTLDILKKIPGPLFSVRFLISKPKAGLFFHRDQDLNFAFGVVRLHIPVITDAKARFFIEDESFHLKSGALYFTDVSKLHGIENRSSLERVHLVLDVGLTRELLNIFPKHFLLHYRARMPFNFYPSRPLRGETSSIQNGRYILPPELRPGSLNIGQTDIVSIRRKGFSTYLVDSKKQEFLLVENGEGWLFSPSLGPGFKLKAKGKDRIEVELSGRIQARGKRQTRIITLKGTSQLC